MLEATVAVARREFTVDVALEVPPGSCLALVGPSGAGKSTILDAVAGIVRPERGRISANGRVWLDTEVGVDLAPQDRGCGFLFQEYALFPHLTVEHNVAYGLRGLERSARRRRALELLDRFGIRRLAGAKPPALSGGERQRVALARALAPEPEVLLLDEPLAALDASTRASASQRLGEVIETARVPVLLVTHDFSEAALLAATVAVIDAGRVVQTGTPAALSSAPKSVFVAGLTGAVILRGLARPRHDGLTEVVLEGGGAVTSTDSGVGPVAVATYPWEITLEPPDAGGTTSALNRLAATVTSVTVLGNRARVGLATPQRFAAEITVTSLERLGLHPGAPVTATFKATASRLLAGADLP